MDKLRSFWNDLPALRLLMPYMAGTMAAISYIHFFNQPINVLTSFQPIMMAASTLLTISLICIAIHYSTNNPSRYYKFRLLSGGSIAIAMFSLGVIMLVFNTEIIQPNHFLHQKKREGIFQVAINTPPMRKAKTIVAQGNFLTDENGKKISGNILMMMPKDSIASSLKYGDYLLIAGKPELLDAPKNPYEFDYAQFQHFKNNYYRIYLPPSNYKIIKRNQGNIILSSIYNWRNYFIHILEQHIIQKDDLSVASAILLGYRDEMSQDIIQAYASSGALHVMSVSGLHVGVIFLALQLLLKRMERNKKLKIIRTLLIVILLIGYGIITGLAPSVLRAVTMFSLFTIAKTFDRDTNMYNILAVTCLILLLANPYFITEVGFKLSFLAVLGIVSLYPIIYKQIAVQNKILNFFWSLTSMSIAAQIATFPIGLYYFHQFPIFFLISNLVVIPISNIIIYLGMILFIIAKLLWLSNGFGYALNLLLNWLNAFILWIEKAPYSLIEAIHISQAEMYLMYIVFAGILLYYYNPKAKYAIATLIVCLCLVTVRAARIIENKNEKLFIVYHVPKHTAISVINKNKVYSRIDSSVLANRSQMLFHIKHHWWALGVEKNTSLDKLLTTKKMIEMPFGTIVFAGNKKILILDKPLKKYIAPTKIEVDEIVLSGNKNISISLLPSYFKFKKLVFDSSNKKWRVSKWKVECDKMSIKYHDVNDFAYISEIY